MFYAHHFLAAIELSLQFISSLNYKPVECKLILAALAISYLQFLFVLLAASFDVFSLGWRGE